MTASVKKLTTTHDIHIDIDYTIVFRHVKMALTTLDPLETRPYQDVLDLHRYKPADITANLFQLSTYYFEGSFMGYTPIGRGSSPSLHRSVSEAEAQQYTSLSKTGMIGDGSVHLQGVGWMDVGRNRGYWKRLYCRTELTLGSDAVCEVHGFPLVAASLPQLSPYFLSQACMTDLRMRGTCR
ncbi:hypothetical protein IAU59_007594 [Kwoniella sp. CBS 9459]